MSLIHTSFRAHDKKVLYHPCCIEKVIELPPQEYASFCCRLDDDYTFIHELRDQLCEDSHGIDHALLVLCEGKDDGILVKSEGYDYARYHAYLSNARQLVQLDWHPALDEFLRKAYALVDKYAKQAVACQLDGQYHICLESIRNSADRVCYHDDLFAEMLSERPEFQLVEQVEDELYLHIAPEYLHAEDDSQYIKITSEEVEVILAKHTLWLHDAGGERADFSKCLLKNMDFAGRSLDLAIFDYAKVVNCRFYNADMNRVSCRGTRFHNCSMTDVAASEAVFRNATFRSTELDRSLLNASNFSGATFYDVSIYSCTMNRCCFDGTDFGDTPTSYARMEGASYNEEAWLGDSHAQAIYTGEINVQNSHPKLLGYSATETRELNSIQEVAAFICNEGVHSDLTIRTEDGTFFLNTFGTFIDRIADMDYRDKLLEVLIPMQLDQEASMGSMTM